MRSQITVRSSELDLMTSSTKNFSGDVSANESMLGKGSPLFNRDHKIGLEDFKIEKVSLF